MEIRDSFVLCFTPPFVHLYGGEKAKEHSHLLRHQRSRIAVDFGILRTGAVVNIANLNFVQGRVTHRPERLCLDPVRHFLISNPRDHNSFTERLAKEMNGYTVSTAPATSLVTPVSSATSSLAENGVDGKGAQAAPGMAQPQSLPPAPGQQELPALPGGSNPPHHPIAEFLYQLTKMLTDDNNEIIEWTGGKIKVHYPERLEGEVLHKYFRHSKFASFQRQLNYFGFRKIAGKGKMSPCSYVNDAATSDIRSLLLIKRKTNGSAARKAAMAQRAAAAAAGFQGHMGLAIPGMPMSADFFKQALTASMGNAAAAQQNLGMIHPGMMFATADQQQAVLHQQAALQQQALQSAAQKQRGESLFLPSDSALAALAQTQRRFSAQDLAAAAKQPGRVGSLEQLQQLTAARNSALNLAGFGFGSAGTLASMGAPALTAPATALAPQPAAPVAPAHPGAPVVPAHPGAPVAPAPAAPAGAMPATAAMNATAALNAAAAASQSSNMFESSSALTALVGNNPAPAPPGTQHGASALSAQGRLSSTNLLRGLPSSGTMFPDSLSSISLSGLLPGATGMSSNRLNSMLSLSSFLSRDPSMAELLPGASNANLASFAAGAPLGNTTLVPLTGAASQYAGQLGGASAALQSLTGASSLLGAAFNPAFYPGAMAAPAPPSAPTAPAPPPPAAPTPAAGAPVGFEPTPIQDMGSRQQ